MQTVNFDLIRKDLNKSMMMALVKIKLEEARVMKDSAELKLEEAIKTGTGQDIYDCAYRVETISSRYGNLMILYDLIKKGV